MAKDKRRRIAALQVARRLVITKLAAGLIEDVSLADVRDFGDHYVIAFPRVARIDPGVVIVHVTKDGLVATFFLAL